MASSSRQLNFYEAHPLARVPSYTGLHTDQYLLLTLYSTLFGWGKGGKEQNYPSSMSLHSASSSLIPPPFTTIDSSSTITLLPLRFFSLAFRNYRKSFFSFWQQQNVRKDSTGVFLFTFRFSLESFVFVIVGHETVVSFKSTTSCRTL